MLKVTLTVPPGQEATPVYEAEGGVEVEVVNGPYLDSTGLQVPLPVVDAGGPTYVISDGSLQAALAVTGLGPSSIPLPAGYAPIMDERFTTLDTDIWEPRLVGATDPRGSWSEAEYAVHVDPSYAGWNGYTPFSTGPDGLTITARRVSELSPAPEAGTVPNDPKTGEAFAWTGGYIQAADSIQFRSGIIDMVVQGGINDPAFWSAIWARPVGGIFPEPDFIEMVGFDPEPTVIHNLILSSGVSYPFINKGGDFYDGQKHWFRCSITDTAFDFYYEGELVYSRNISDLPSAQALFYPIVNLTVGSNLVEWVEPPNGSTPSPMTWTVKQLRISRKAGPDSLNITETTILDANTPGALGALSHTSFGDSTGGTYSLVDNGSGRFTLAGSTVSMTSSAAGAYSFVAQVTDNEGNSWSRKFNVTVVADSLGTNLLTAPTDFNNAAHNKYDATLPTPAVFPQRVQENTATSQHALSQLYTKPATKLNYTLAIDVIYDGSTEWVKLEIANAFATPTIASYNLRTGALGVIWQQDASNVIVRRDRANQNLGGGVRRLLLAVEVAASITSLRYQMKFLAADNEFGNRTGSTANGIKVKKVQLVQV